MFDSSFENNFLFFETKNHKNTFNKKKYFLFLKKIILKNNYIMITIKPVSFQS